MSDDGLWRNGAKKEEKPRPKYNFDTSLAEEKPGLFPAPDGKMYINPTEYYRSLKGELN